ncbi:MAG: replicative DNA helicase [Eubacteriales bacterium]|nr:replicative DNA helicase [Eubacteriales bacterium]
MPQTQQNRVAPHNLNAEKSVLGAMMLDQRAVSAAVESLSGEDFYYPANTVIFNAMMELTRKGDPVDFVTVTDVLERQGTLEGAGGYEYVTELSNFVPSAANASHYADIVKQHARLRQLIAVAGRISQDCYEMTKSTEEILQSAEKAIFDISQSGVKRSFIPIRQAVQEVVAQIEDKAENGETIVGISSGFDELDVKIKGFSPSQLILIAARPAMGKSAFAMNIIQFAAVYRQKSAAVFSLEMPYDQLVQRMLSTGSKLPLENLRIGNLRDPNDWTRLSKTANELGGSRIFIDDTPSLSVMEMQSKCRRLKLEQGLDIIMIDYLQLINGAVSGQHTENRQQEVSEMTRALKLMARELNVPILLLSQLSRAPEQRPNHRPMLADLRESGAIEQDADIVMFLYRGSYYEDFSGGNEAEVIVAKQRNGPTGTAKIFWDSETASYVNVDRFGQAPPPGV